jgi:peptidyl-prolyl cis-trans isomerase SurA
MLPLLLLAVVLNTARGAVVIDRISVVAGKHIIKASDIDRDIRITDFLNRAPVAINPETKRKSADRLIDQAIIRDEIASGGYPRATDADAAAMMDGIRQNQYGGAEARFKQALSQYGITEPELQAELLWQLTVLKFIDERFRPGVLVTDQEVRDYYNAHLAALKRQYPRDSSFATLAPSIRSSMEGEQINKQFEMWLDDARQRMHIEYMQGAFQ